MNDAPALSAAQVGIAVQGATDAAKNAADLILTKPGLSPIYGAVLESRRIFTRIKSYVVYRVAASLILVLTLSIIIFVTGCAVDSILIIVLALLNDISMIPVAYDNASATTHPQLPRAQTLVYQSLYYGLTHAAFSLMVRIVCNIFQIRSQCLLTLHLIVWQFIFCMDYDKMLEHQIDLATCDGETRGLIWMQLLVVTELAIFSVRAPSFFLFSMPSIYLIISVLVTLVIGGVLACLLASLGLHLVNLGYIVMFNLAAFVVVDILKIKVREIIGEAPGEIIKSDELIQPPARTEAEKHFRKSLRYVVHEENVLGKDDRYHVVEVESRNWRKSLAASFLDLGTGFNINGGFVRRSGPFRNIRNPRHPATDPTMHTNM